MGDEARRHTIAVLVENKFGVLARVAGFFSSRGFNIESLSDIFRAKVVDVSPKTYTLEVTGDQGKIRAMLDLLHPYGVKEIARSGKVALARGTQAMKT